MIVELFVPAWLVVDDVGAAVVGGPVSSCHGLSIGHPRLCLWVASSSLHVGRYPDSIFGLGRHALCAFGACRVEAKCLCLSGLVKALQPPWHFLMVGAGLQTSQTAGLALATDQASEETRPRVVALMYTMLLVGAVFGSLAYSFLLSNFTPEYLVQTVQGTALVVLILNGALHCGSKSRATLSV